MKAPEPKPWINEIHAYVPGKSTGADGQVLVKLSANENPLGTSAAALAALNAPQDAAARYPDPDSRELREAIGALNDLDPAQIVCGTGSDELLNLAAQGYAGPGDEVIYMRYGFSVYEIAARRVGATPVVVDDKDYATDVDAMLAAVTDKTRVVFLANPNNPTGTLASADEIRRLADELPSDVLFVLDQAYAEYLSADEEDGGLELAKSRENILVTRTFSKIYGLAGERIGWAYGAPGIVATLNRIRGPFNVTASGQRAAIAALSDGAFVEASRDHNRIWREWLANEVAQLSNHGLRAVPSGANFLLILFEGEVAAVTVYDALMQAGYIVRHLPGQGLPHGLRITIGAEADMRAIADVLRNTVSQ